jgi:hypothetical protein
MTIDEDPGNRIVEIIGDLRCPKDFKCVWSGFKNLCKAKVAGTESHVLICLEKQVQKCKFLNLKGGHICECPLRIYLAKNLKK